MADHVIKDPKVFNLTVQKLTREDYGDGDVFAAIHEKLVNNDAYLNEEKLNKDGSKVMTGPLMTPNLVTNRPLISEENQTYYLDYANGSDDNDGLTIETAFKTWGKLQTLIPYFIRHAYYIRIVGDYFSDIIIENVMSARVAGRLDIIGHTGIKANHKIKKVIARNVLIPSITTSISLLSYVELQESLDLYNCNTVVTQLDLRTTGEWGIRCYTHCYATVANCDFEGNYGGIYSVSSKVYSLSNAGLCTNFGLGRASGGEVYKSGTQPTGAVSNEVDQNVVMRDSEKIISSGFASGWSGQIRHGKLDNGMKYLTFVDVTKTSDISTSNDVFYTLTTPTGVIPTRAEWWDRQGLTDAGVYVDNSTIGLLASTNGQLSARNTGGVKSNVRRILNHTIFYW